MASLEQIGAALKAADAAGNVDDARRLAQAYKAARDQQPAPVSAPAQPQAGPMDFLTQGMSGINEGIASALGAPVDLTTAGLNLAGTGINRLFGTQIPAIEHPMGGAETFKGILAPTIKPQTDNPALQATRRVSQEVGAMLIPGMKPVAMAAKPLQVAGKELAMALGSGTGAAVAQQAFPGNPLAELGGQVLGGFSPTMLESAASRALPKAAKMAPVSLDDLKAQTDAAYGKTRQINAAYAPKTYDNMLVKIIDAAKADGISEDRHKDAYSFLVDMVAGRGKPVSLTELDQLRQRVRRDLITPSYGNQAKAADAHFGQIMLDQIDNMIAEAKPSDMAAGSATEAANAILEARSLYAKTRKVELLQDAVGKAKLQAASSGSGGNINNAVRQQFKSILNNPKKVKSFTAEERAAMEDLVKQGKADDLVRLLGKAAPGNNGLVGVLEILATLHNPAAAALPIAGIVAKGIADRGTLTKAEKIQQMVMGGPVSPAPPLPFLSPEKRARLAALALAQGANQNKQPLQITVQGGSAR